MVRDAARLALLCPPGKGKPRTNLGSKSTSGMRLGATGRGGFCAEYCANAPPLPGTQCHPLHTNSEPAEIALLSSSAREASLLWLVPWAALPLPHGKDAVEKYSILHLVSGRDLVEPP